MSVIDEVRELIIKIDRLEDENEALVEKLEKKTGSNVITGKVFVGVSENRRCGMVFSYEHSSKLFDENVKDMWDYDRSDIDLMKINTPLASDCEIGEQVLNYAPAGEVTQYDVVIILTLSLIHI